MPQWSTFQCDEPDFVVRSIPDGDCFKVQRQCLEQGSSVFGDMFSCCESGYVFDSLDEDTHTLDLMESSTNLNLLFRFLHNPPVPYEEEKAEKSPIKSSRIHLMFPQSAIPFPLIPSLLKLADKYALSPELTECLYSHLASYASVFPLRVYGYAVELGLDSIAAKTSMYLLDPPLSSYSVEDLKAIPTAEAYHKLVLLHDFRIKRLREILRGESIFPHGYGECSRHAQKTVFIWERRKEDILHLIEAATDVAAEMAQVKETFVQCETCTRACTAALSMLEYKCAKVPKRNDRIPI
ncbi:unnamed protein product [Somion occarium]|uniref:BTB domain-containing protein n=1 Tax=Somion occarium TaxID=3059160 RepID=A0ABP1CLB3_9APHY